MRSSKTDLFLDRVVAAAGPVFGEVLAVHRAGGEPVGIRTIFEEPHAQEGPVFGIAAAMKDARGKAFVIAVDYPLVTTEMLRYLKERFERSTAPALVPQWDGRAQPLCACYDSSLLPLVERRIAAGMYDLRGLVAEAGAQLLDETGLRARFGGEPLMNVNTLDELETAVRHYGSEGLFPPR